MTDSQTTEAEKIVRSYYDAFNTSGAHGVLALLTDDVMHDIS